MTAQPSQAQRSQRPFPALWWISHMLVLIWAAFWTWFGAVSGAKEVGLWRNFPNALPGFLFLVFAILAFRWERVFGWVFCAIGAGLAVLSIAEQDGLLSIIMMLLLFAAPPLVAGILMLVRTKRLGSSD